MESHQTTSVLCGLFFLSDTLFSAHNYPEGALHLVPLLTLCLPGIDANDAIKTQYTLAFFSHVFTIVPFVDCSEDDLTQMSETQAEIYARMQTLR